MAFALTWLPDVLEKQGLKVAEVNGWQTAGHGDMGEVRGIMCHHTAGPLTGNMPTLRVVKEGRPDLKGPLSQLALGRDGTFYVVAAGRAYHAGAGTWHGITDGNSSFVGIEAENTGKSDDRWPDIQMDAYRHGVAAILAHIGSSQDMCCGHREFALPPGRKTDPNFDMDDFRAQVGHIMQTRSTIDPIPVVDATGLPTIRRGASGSIVVDLQRKIGFDPVNGDFDAGTEAMLRQFQIAHHLVPDGIAGPKTWAVLAGVA
jgi:N-acetyl-anhydromuramyl-L-alanine amidase AmpD